jgi:hypothetical protein
MTPRRVLIALAAFVLVGVTLIPTAAESAGGGCQVNLKVGESERVSTGFGTIVESATSANPGIATAGPDNRAGGGGATIKGVAVGTTTVTIKYDDGSGNTKTLVCSVKVTPGGGNQGPTGPPGERCDPQPDHGNGPPDGKGKKCASSPGG